MRFFRSIGQLALVGLIVAALPVPAAIGATDEDPGVPGASVSEILADQMVQTPGGVIEGDRIVYPDGSYFVAVEAETFSLNQCTNGYFCGWAQSNFSGSFFAVSGSGVKTLSWSTRSYWNRRATIANLFNNAGTGSTCFEAYESRATIGSGYYSPAKVTLAAGASC